MAATLDECFDILRDVRQLLPSPNKTLLDIGVDLDQLRPHIGSDLYEEWLASTGIMVSAETLMEATMESWQHKVEHRAQTIQYIKSCIDSLSY